MRRATSTSGGRRGLQRPNRRSVDSSQSGATRCKSLAMSAPTRKRASAACDCDELGSASVTPQIMLREGADLGIVPERIVDHHDGCGGCLLFLLAHEHHGPFIAGGPGALRLTWRPHHENH